MGGCCTDGSVDSSSAEKDLPATGKQCAGLPGCELLTAYMADMALPSLLALLPPGHG